MINDCLFVRYLCVLANRIDFSYAFEHPSGCRCVALTSSYPCVPRPLSLGVVGPVPGVIGTLQAVEVIKLLVKANIKPSDAEHSNKLKNLIGRQLYYDAASSEFHEFSLRPRSVNCLSCQHLYATPSSTVSSPFPVAQQSNLPATSMTACDKQTLSTKHRIQAADYHASVLQLKVPHVLLDVRSALQYSIISLKPFFPLSSSCGTPCYDLESDSRPEAYCPMTLVNIPYADLLAASLSLPLLEETSSASESGKASGSSALSSLQTLKQAIFPEAPIALASASTLPLSSSPAPLPVYRGIDSVKATELLLDLLQAETFHRLSVPPVTGTTGTSSTSMSNTPSQSQFQSQVQVFDVQGGLTAWHAEVDPSFPKY